MKCKICKKEFEKTSWNRCYCSNKCNQIAFKERYPDRAAQYAKAYRGRDQERYNSIINKYRKSKKGKMATRSAASKWYDTPKGKSIRNKYKKTDKYKLARQKWLKTKVGRIYMMRKSNKRKRQLGFIPIMDNPFPNEIGIDWHHINDILVIPTPKTLHQQYIGDRENHRLKCNDTLQEWGLLQGVQIL